MTQRRIPIAEANRGLSRVVRQAERDGEIALTRHGQPVAVLLSMNRYREVVSEAPRSIVDVVQELRASNDLAEIDFDSEEFLRGLREDESGRDFSW